MRAAILKVPEKQRIASLATDGSPRPNGQIVEITDLLDLTAWPDGSRVLVRRERAHPGAQLSFTDHDGHGFQAVVTDQTDLDIQTLERRHRQRARCEDHIRNDKDTGLRNMPFRDFEHNRVTAAWHTGPLRDIHVRLMSAIEASERSHTPRPRQALLKPSGHLADPYTTDSSTLTPPA